MEVALFLLMFVIFVCAYNIDSTLVAILKVMVEIRDKL